MSSSSRFSHFRDHPKNILLLITEKDDETSLFPTQKSSPSRNRMKTGLKLSISSVIVFFLLFNAALGFAQPSDIKQVGDLSSLEKALVIEMNMARTNPNEYASLLEKWGPYYDGRLLNFPGEVSIQTKEGWKAVAEAIRFLRSTHPMPLLNLSRGMSQGARDHAKDLGSSGMRGHKGRDGSQPWDRVSRYGTLKNPTGENISYWLNQPQQIVMGLIIDDGVPDRGHRKNIFNPDFRVLGVACSEHTTYRMICVFTFAGAFIEK